MMRFGDGGRIALQIRGQGLDDFFGHRTIRQFTHYGNSFSGVVVSWTRDRRARFAVSAPGLLGHKFLKDHRGIIAAEAKCVQ